MLRTGLVSVSVSVAVAGGLLLAPAAARACSCLALRHPTVEGCQFASRVFAGTVGAYDWPTALRATADDSVTIELVVDTVWRGAVPAKVIVQTHPLGGPGSCAVYPAPGEPFLVCDSEEGDAAPSLGFCAGPALGDDAAPLIAALGPGAAPSEAPPRPRRPWWTDPKQLKESTHALLLLALPFAAALLGAGLGAILPWRRPGAQVRPSRRRIVVMLLAAALLVIGARLALHRQLPPDRLLFDCVTLGPSALAGLVGLVVGFRAQRRGARGVRGLALALVAVAVVLTAGYARLHVPVQPADAVACTEARARDHLDAYPRPSSRDAALEWARSAPRACTDWGLAPIKAEEGSTSPALAFTDGRGGMYWLYARSPSDIVRTYLWELP
ncbi:MAG: hypothetical protein KC486_08275 [Myxococcales bacterium]|nr:hypothetical protein [Myxococcales bacterium]